MSQLRYLRYLRRGGLLIAALALISGAVAVGTLAGEAADAASGAAFGATQAGAVRQASTHDFGKQDSGKQDSGKHASMLNGVWCTGGQCVAVGSWYDNPPTGHSLAERFDGTTWQRQASPDGPTDSFLTGVSCAAVPHGAPDAIDCLAVGNLTIAEANGSWRLVAKASNLDAVSCAEPNDCVAVGAEPSTPKPIFARWNGHTLQAGQLRGAPHPAQTVTIAGVSCATPVDCVAVGDYSYGVSAQPGPGSRDRTLAEEWNGRSWRLLPTVNVSDWNQLSAVSCASADNCTAVGSSQNQFALAEHWNGETWRVESVPPATKPAALGYLPLTSVSCPTAKFCVAAGAYDGSVPVAETWNGSTWRLTRLPLPANQSASLRGIACASATACVAVGTGPTADAYAEIYARGTWRQLAPKNPA